MKAETDAMAVDEAASYLCVSAGQIRKLCNLGRLPHVRLGKRMILHRHKLDQWIESNTKGK